MKKQTIITACTFAAMTMATPAVFAVQPAMSNHAGYPSNSVTLVTNQIIKMLCFDATEPKLHPRC